MNNLLSPMSNQVPNLEAPLINKFNEKNDTNYK